MLLSSDIALNDRMIIKANPVHAATTGASYKYLPPALRVNISYLLKSMCMQVCACGCKLINLMPTSRVTHAAIATRPLAADQRAMHG